MHKSMLDDKNLGIFNSNAVEIEKMLCIGTPLFNKSFLRFINCTTVCIILVY